MTPLTPHIELEHLVNPSRFGASMDTFADTFADYITCIIPMFGASPISQCRPIVHIAYTFISNARAVHGLAHARYDRNALVGNELTKITIPM